MGRLFTVGLLARVEVVLPNDILYFDGADGNATNEGGRARGPGDRNLGLNRRRVVRLGFLGLSIHDDRLQKGKQRTTQLRRGQRRRGIRTGMRMRITTHN